MKTKMLSFIISLSVIIGMMSIPVSASTNGITLSGTCHVQDYGDTNGIWDEATGTLTLGTRGQSKRVEAITINMTNDTGYGGSLKYRVHVQDIGWQEYRYAGEMAGTSGQSKRLEGIEMELTGDLAAYYTVEYAVHIQDYGDAQGFVSDGALAGTTGESKRLEEVQIRIVPRGTGSSMSVNYRVHRQDYGWESAWSKDGSESGTTGQAKRLEGIEIHLTGNQYAGSIEYRTHVQNIGWETNWSKDGEMSGTQGLSYRLEGIEIQLTGDIANYYDVYYRVHAQDYGWLGWAKNGEMSGTSGLSKRLEAIQIVLVAKDGPKPGNVAGISSVYDLASVTPDSDLAHNWVEYSYVQLEPTVVNAKIDYVYYANLSGEEVAYYSLGDWYDINGNPANDRFEMYECYYVSSFTVPFNNTSALELVKSLTLENFGVWTEQYWYWGPTTRDKYQALIDQGKLKPEEAMYHLNCDYRVAFKVSDIAYLQSLGIQMSSYSNGYWLGFDGERINHSRVDYCYKLIETEEYVKHTYYICSDCGAYKE